MLQDKIISYIIAVYTSYVLKILEYRNLSLTYAVTNYKPSYNAITRKLVKRTKKYYCSTNRQLIIIHEMSSIVN